MTEYIITREQLVEVFEKLHSWDFPEWLHEFVYTRKLFCPKLPEIVRCRDCRFSLAHGNGCGRNQDIYDAEPDGFCAWAERRVDDAD